MHSLQQDGSSPSIDHMCHSWSFVGTETPFLLHNVLHLFWEMLRTLMNQTMVANRTCHEGLRTQRKNSSLPVEGANAEKVQEGMFSLSLDCRSD